MCVVAATASLKHGSLISFGLDLPTAQLYNTLYDYALTLEKVAELTVEDPSEAFEDVRDRCDLVRLKEQLKGSKEMAKGAPVDKKWLEKIRTERKYASVCAELMMIRETSCA
jgi:hypothetical protein